MTTEEKAQRYEEAIKVAKDSFNYPDYPGFIRADVVFPELKESEDEKIRKLLIEAVIQVLQDQYCSNRGVSKEKVIAWLERQSEQKHDKVEPKFKAGDWIITPDNQIKQIKSVSFGNYRFTDGSLYNIIDVDNKGHLWSIADAKDGDILVNGSNIFIFSHFSDIARVMGYCHINLDDIRFYNDKDKNECFGLLMQSFLLQLKNSVTFCLQRWKKQVTNGMLKRKS